MSDYLSRIAERAGPAAAPAVRPRLASRYEGTAEPVPSVASSESEVEPGAPASRPRESAKSPAHLPVQPLRTAVSPTPPLPHRPTAPPPIVPAPTVPQGVLFHDPITREQETAPDRGDSGEKPPRAAAPPPVPLLVERIILRESLPAEGHGKPKVMPVPPVVARGAVEKTALPPPHAKQSPPTRRVKNGTVGTQPVRSISSTRPAPLLEPARRPLPPVILPPAATPPAPPSVNITIGRLEIRAAVPAAEHARRKPQTAGHGPLPLDEFLRGKSPRRRGRA